MKYLYNIELYLKQGIGKLCVMGDISFALAYSSCEEREPKITKWTILADSGTPTHDPWIAKPLPLPLGHGIWK